MGRIAPPAPNCYNRTEMNALKDRAKQLKKGATMAKKHKEVLKLLVTLEPGEDGYIIAECPAIPGCATQGKSEEEALANIKEAIVGCLKVRQEMGLATDGGDPRGRGGPLSGAPARRQRARSRPRLHRSWLDRKAPGGEPHDLG